MIFASQSKTKFKAFLAATVLCAGTIALAAPADARMGMGGGFHGGMGMGGFHGGMGGFGGFHGGMGGGFRPPIFHQGFRGGFGGFHPGFAGRPFVTNRAFFNNRGAFNNRAFFFRRNHFFNNNAFATGLFVGGLGGLAYGYPYYDYGYDYGYPYYSTAYYGGDCYYVRRRVVNPWGHIVVRRVAVCGY
ncbi:hypothetical protein [Microvirga sp. 2TAF3]|uniref:hypothetical protein n=1 Tax=Microvirga sp. 2TAF3 TaxID=3233014 RepID=UPI003F9ABEC1